MADQHPEDSLTRSGRPPRPSGFQQECARIRRLLELEPSNRVADIGCGDGGVARTLAPLCLQWTGCDFSEKMLRAARREAIPNAGYVLATAGRLPFREHTFDKVLVYSSLHYLSLEDAKRAIEEAKRVCRPGGRVLLGDLPDASRKRAYEAATGFGWFRKALGFASGVLRYLTRRPRLIETWFATAWVSAASEGKPFIVRILDRDSPYRFDVLLLRR